MNDKIIYYVQKLSDNKKVQENLIIFLGKIFVKQIDFDKYVEKNNEKIIHIRDWIISVIENNEDLKNPRVLTIEALYNAANKYFKKQNNKLKTIELNEKDEKLIADLGDYYVVQMLTSESLDNESIQMQHCIGYGGYDKKVKNLDYQYLSLRDKFNKAHVTLEVRNENIKQLQGKQNKIPDKKYLEILLPWLMENEYEAIPWLYFSKYFDNGQWIDLKYIKVIENVDYIISYYQNIKLIQCLNEKAKIYFTYLNKITGFYVLSNVNRKILFYELNSHENQYCFFKYLLSENYKNIPFFKFDLFFDKIENQIYSISEIPNNYKIDNLNLFRSEINKLPDNLSIDKDLILSCCKRIKELPKCLIVGGNISLSLSINIKKIPDDIKIGGNLNLYMSDIQNLPENLEIGGDLLLSDSYIKDLPDNLKCNTIAINKKQKHLIKKSIDFKYVKIIDRVYEDIIYEKEKFFENTI